MLSAGPGLVAGDTENIPEMKALDQIAWPACP
jgi:hypothetical protein